MELFWISKLVKVEDAYIFIALAFVHSYIQINLKSTCLPIYHVIILMNKEKNTYFEAYPPFSSFWVIVVNITTSYLWWGSLRQGNKVYLIILYHWEDVVVIQVFHSYRLSSSDMINLCLSILSLCQIWV